MRPYCSIGQLAFAFVGCVIFAVLAVVAKFFFNSLISDRLHLNLPLTPNATSGITSFSVWKDIPFPVHDKFYFFHVENPDEVSCRLSESYTFDKKGVKGIIIISQPSPSHLGQLSKDNDVR